MLSGVPTPPPPRRHGRKVLSPTVSGNIWQQLGTGVKGGIGPCGRSPRPAGVGTAAPELGWGSQVGLHRSRPWAPSRLPWMSQPLQACLDGVGEKRVPKGLWLLVVPSVGLGAGAPAEVHVIQGHLPSMAMLSLTSEDDALDIGPSQGDMCVPPATATGSAPYRGSGGSMLPHKHLEGA